MIAISLREPDRDVLLDLAAPFTVAYDAGRYGKIINYDSHPAAPVFFSPDAAWVRSMIAKPANNSET